MYESSCSSCNVEGCSSRKAEDFSVPANAKSHIQHVIGIVSGKGGVGKSLVTSELAVLLQKRGYKVGILDADITGPSIPKVFGLHGQAFGTDDGIIPFETKTGIKVMSVNLILDDEETPVVWRGPVIAGVVKQFWNEVVWGELDYLLVDMPPGTGDVPLTVFQSLPVDGIVVVTSPQELVGMIVKKAYNMAQMMKYSGTWPHSEYELYYLSGLLENRFIFMVKAMVKKQPGNWIFRLCVSPYDSGDCCTVRCRSY